MQRIPWPRTHTRGDDSGDDDADIHDTWELDEYELPWLLDSNGELSTGNADQAWLAHTLNGRAVTVEKILYSRHVGVETWITSDGRAYLVQLYDNPPDEADREGEDGVSICAAIL